MRGILLFFVVVSTVYGAQETISDLYELLKDPTLLAQIEKRLGADFDVDDDLFSDVDGCYDTSGTVNSECNFYANGSAIIKTSESIARGAEFLKEYVNITCPRDCTALCCDFANCDTSVYQDKDEHKCYLFHCGDKSNCVFTHHGDYWTGSISKETHKSHSFAPGGATHSHENELENLGSHGDDFPSTTSSPPPTTTVKTTTSTTTIASLPGLGKYCPSYGSKCEDPHAECVMKSCKCRVGYHEKHGICRKHCRNEEFECENYTYYSNVDSRECIPNEFVCDGNSDCIDASDESKCQDTSKQDDQEPPRKPVIDNDGNRNNPLGPHPDRVKPAVQKQTTVEPFVSTGPPTTPTIAAPIHTEPTQTVKSTGANIVTPDSQASANNDQDMKPVSNEEDSSSDNQSADTSESKNSNKTESVDEKTGSTNKFNILNAESVEVTSYTDSFQGPIVALALGLAITLILLIFVGCRLRTVKRRLRKGRALHSNEADYLINGMYL